MIDGLLGERCGAALDNVPPAVHDQHLRNNDRKRALSLDGEVATIRSDLKGLRLEDADGAFVMDFGDR